MVADPGPPALGEAEGVLELGAAGEQRRRLDRQREARGHEAARAPHDQRAGTAAADRAQRPSRRSGLDRAVVEEEEVGDPAEPLERVVVAVGDRLVGDVAARHHQRHAGVGEQQHVQRRVGEHHAEVGRDGATDGATGAAGRRRATTIGRSRPVSRLCLALVELDQLARGLEVARHQRERLVLAVLARAQRGDRRLVVGAAGEVEAADALDREDSARAQLRRGSGDRVALAATARRRRRSASRARGPHSGQALGWAWKRRSRGSSYSARQRSHISKPAIVVSGRS